MMVNPTTKEDQIVCVASPVDTAVGRIAIGTSVSQ
jgi:hypothetical protein